MAEAFEVPAEFLPSFQRALGIKMGVGEEGEGLAWVDVDKEMHWGRTGANYVALLRAFLISDPEAPFLPL